MSIKCLIVFYTFGETYLLDLVSFLYIFQNIEVKKNLTLVAKVVGKPEPEVAWFVNSTEIKPTFKIKQTKEKEVATLTITGVTMNMTGEYTIVATNSVGTTSHSAKITVCGEY